MERHLGQREEGTQCEHPVFWNDVTRIPRLNDACVHVRNVSLLGFESDRLIASALFALTTPPSLRLKLQVSIITIIILKNNNNTAS